MSSRSRIGRLPATWWFKSVAAGLVGGIAMVLTWNIGSALIGDGFWRPLNAIGTTMPERDLITGAFSSLSITGAFLHTLTSACWGIIFGMILGLVAPQFGRTMGRATLAGLVFGLGVYVLMGQIIGPWLNPAITTIQGMVYFLGHLVFGAVTGASLYAMARRRELSVTFAPGVASRDRVTTLRR
ncbi:hypothetical protein D3C72_738600 [compost metagenome]